MKQRSKHSGADDLVFSSSKGTPLNENNLMRRQVKPAAKLLGVPWLSWHVFRHTHATLGEQIGMALSDRQAQMGHGDVRMAMHYTHSDLARRRAAIENMTDQLMGQAAGTVN
jgi:integrase